MSISIGVGISIGKMGRHALDLDAPYAGTAYNGPVATRCGMPTNKSSNKQANSRTFHVSTENLSSVAVVLPNWLWTRSTAGPEAGSLGTITYEAAIEKLDGSITRLPFAGANAGVSVTNSIITSDYANVSLKKGEGFYLRTYAIASAGIVFTDGNASPPTWQVDFSKGEAYEYGPSGITNKVMGGAFSHNLGEVPQASVLRPIAILGQTTKATVGIVGDSRDWGFGDKYDTNLGGGIGDAARSLSDLGLAYVNMGSSSDKFSAFIAAHARRVEALNFCSHIYIGDAINSLRASGENKTAATVLGELDTVMGYFPTKRIILSTLGGPNPASTNNFIDEAGQTVNGNHAQINIYNNAIRAGRSPAIGFIEIADQIESARSSGKWWTNGVANDTTYEGLHGTPKSYQRIQAAKVFPRALFSRVGL